MAEEPVMLSAADVETLLRDPSAAGREAAATKVAVAFSNLQLGERERALAEEIFRTFVRDTEVRVRAALADQLKRSREVPHDIALTLARDVARVAGPILEFSSVLTDEDLVEIVASASGDHQVAVAKRASLGAEVVSALTDKGGEEAVATLMENHDVEIGEAAFARAIDRFGTSARVNTPMAKRPKLPLGIAERLVTLVSDSLRDHLVAHHELTPDMATDLVLSTRERVTLSLTADANQPDVIRLVHQLNNNRRLTPTIVLRALCLGDTDFFEAAVAEIAGVSVVNAHKLIHDPGDLGLKAIYQHCKLPMELYPLARAAIDVATEIRHDGEPGDRQRFTERMIERLLTRAENSVDAANLDYLINKIGKVAA